MKTIIISEDFNWGLLKESILKKELPDSLIDVIERNKTSLGNNPAIPNHFG